MYRTVVTICTAQWSIYVPHSGRHYIYRTVVTICTAQRSLYLPHSGHYMYHQFDSHQCNVLPTQCIYVFCVDLRRKSDHIALPDWLCKRQGVCLLRGTSCAVAETSEHGVSRTSSFYYTCVFVVSRNRSLSRTVVIHHGKGCRQTSKAFISLPAQCSQNHSESLRSVLCAVTRG